MALIAGNFSTGSALGNGLASIIVAIFYCVFLAYLVEAVLRVYKKDRGIVYYLKEKDARTKGASRTRYRSLQMREQSFSSVASEYA